MGRRESTKSSPTSSTSVRPSRKKEQKKKKKDRSNSTPTRSEDEEAITAPDYSVEEDRYGRLVNREKRLVWPSTKQLSRKEWKKFAARSEKPASVSTLDSFSEIRTITSDSKSSSEYLTFHEKYAYGSEDDVFIGSATEQEATTKVEGHHAGFVLYYRLDKTKLIPDQIDLCMCYRRTNGNFMHFPIVRRSYRRDGNIHDEYYWRVEAGEANRREFTSLPALIKFYRLFSYIDPLTGAIETFPFFD